MPLRPSACSRCPLSPARARSAQEAVTALLRQPLACLPRAGACVLTVGTPCETTPSRPTPKAHLRTRPIRPCEVGQLDGRSAAGRPARDRPLRPEQLVRAHALRTQTASRLSVRRDMRGSTHVERRAAQPYAEAAEAVRPKQCDESDSNCRAQPPPAGSATPRRRYARRSRVRRCLVPRLTLLPRRVVRPPAQISVAAREV